MMSGTQKCIVKLRYLVTEPSPFEVEMAIEKSKMYKSQGTDQILIELIQAG
jgi:hypothetical protein